MWACFPIQKLNNNCLSVTYKDWATNKQQMFKENVKTVGKEMKKCEGILRCKTAFTKKSDFTKRFNPMLCNFNTANVTTV